MSETILQSQKHEVIIARNRPATLIGERINPAAKKRLADCLKENNLEPIRMEAKAQAQAGADVLSVSVTGIGLDEVDFLPRTVELVDRVAQLPLCINSPNPLALEAALEVYKGKGRPLITPVYAEEDSLNKVLPLAQKYNCAVLAVLEDEEGIAPTVEQRMHIAHRIVERAASAGIDKKDVLFNCLAVTVGAQPSSAKIAFDTMRQIVSELKCNVILETDSISLGLPDKLSLVTAYAAMGMYCGAAGLIADVAKIKPVVLAADVLLKHDPHMQRYMDDYNKRSKEPPLTI